MSRFDFAPVSKPAPRPARNVIVNCRITDQQASELDAIAAALGLESRSAVVLAGLAALFNSLSEKQLDDVKASLEAIEAAPVS